MSGLSADECVQFLREVFGIAVTREQMASPSRELLLEVLSRFLSEVGVESLVQPDLLATSHVSSIETHEAFIAVANVYKCCAHLLSSLGFHSTTLADVTQPQRKRSARIVSLFISLWTRLYNVRHEWNQLQLKCADRPVRRQALERHIGELRARVEQKSLWLSANAKRSADSARELKELALEFEQKKSASELLADDSKRLKSDLLFKRQQMSETELEMSKAREEIAELEIKLIRSPERIQAETRDRELELDAKRDEKQKLERQYVESVRALDVQRETAKALKPTLETFGEEFKDIEKLRAKCESLLELKASAKNKEQKLSELKIQLKQHELSAKELRKQLNANERQFSQRIKTAKQLHEGLVSELDARDETQSAAKKALVEERMRLEKCLHGMKTAHEKFCADSENYRNEERKKVDNMYSLLNSRLNEMKI